MLTGDTVIHAKEGDSIFAPRNVPHSFVNVSSTTSRALVTIVPGVIEEFFVEVGELPPGPPNPALIGPLLEKYGLEFEHPAAH
jgi:hypothetical protein